MRVFILIPIPRLGKKRSRKRSSPALLYVLAAVLLLIAIGAGTKVANPKPTCQGVEVLPGQACVDPSGTSTTYDQLRSSEQTFALWGTVGLGAISLGCFGLACHQSNARRRRIAAAAMRQAKREFGITDVATPGHQSFVPLDLPATFGSASTHGAAPPLAGSSDPHGPANLMH